MRALAEWGKERWPEEAEGVLAVAVRQEPNDEVRKNMRRVLKGRSFEEPKFKLGKAR